MCLENGSDVPLCTVSAVARGVATKLSRDSGVQVTVLVCGVKNALVCCHQQRRKHANGYRFGPRMLGPARSTACLIDRVAVCVCCVLRCLWCVLFVIVCVGAACCVCVALMWLLCELCVQCS